MAERSDQLKKLLSISTDLELTADLRVKAIELLGNIGTHDALLSLLELAANKDLEKEERDLALKHARKIIKLGN